MSYSEKYKMQQEKDLARVKAMLESLSSYWMQRPYLRLGQIVSNAWRILPEYKSNPEPELSDIYYLNDDRLQEGLVKLESMESEPKSKRPTDN
jgi:hypothetical protein